MANAKVIRLSEEPSDPLDDIRYYAELAVQQLKRGEATDALGTVSYIAARAWGAKFQQMLAKPKGRKRGA